MTAAASIKPMAHAVVDRLPDDASWKDIMYEMSIVQDIEEAMAESEAGLSVTTDVVLQQFNIKESVT